MAPGLVNEVLCPQGPYAHPLMPAIDARLPQLKMRFNYDFAKDGLPDRYFRRPSGKPDPDATPNGLIHTEVSHDDTQAYSLIQPFVEMHGDFDVTLRFDDLQMPDLYSAAGLGLYIGDNGSEAEFKFLAAEGVSAIFSWNPDGRHVLMSRAGLLHEYDIETGQIAPMPGHSADPAKDGAVWDTAGRRIVFINRRGKRIDITINAIQSKPQRLAAA